MGGLLAKPITDKSTSSGGNSMLRYAHAGMQGWRNTMEDAETTITSLIGYPDWSYFGVYDGHGGSRTSAYCEKFLHQRVTTDPSFPEGDVPTALSKGFINLDADIVTDPAMASDTSGSAVIVVVLNSYTGQLYCANAGDCRAVMSRAGAAFPLSTDHKPDVPTEMERIQAAGGSVRMGRVNGALALSRAVGDRSFKDNANLSAEDQAVTARPDVLEALITPDDEFIIIACDGIWDVLSSQQAVDFVRPRIAAVNGPEDLVVVAAALVDHCLADTPTVRGVGCDNMTVIIVQFLHPGIRSPRKKLVDGERRLRRSKSMNVRPGDMHSAAAAKAAASPDGRLTMTEPKKQHRRAASGSVVPPRTIIQSSF